MKIGERLARNDVDDQIYIGQMIEQHLAGEFGELLKCIIEGIKQDKLQESESNTNISPNRVLGMIVGLAALQSRLDVSVDIARGLIEEKREEQEVPSKEPEQ